MYGRGVRNTYVKNVINVRPHAGSGSTPTPTPPPQTGSPVQVGETQHNWRNNKIRGWGVGEGGNISSRQQEITDSKGLPDRI